MSDSIRTSTRGQVEFMELLSDALYIKTIKIGIMACKSVLTMKAWIL